MDENGWTLMAVDPAGQPLTERTPIAGLQGVDLKALGRAGEVVAVVLCRDGQEVARVTLDPPRQFFGPMFAGELLRILPGLGVLEALSRHLQRPDENGQAAFSQLLDLQVDPDGVQVIPADETEGSEQGG